MKMFRGAAVAAAIAGSMLSVNAQAVNLATDGIGEVAIAPFYTVRDGWSTLINLTNTQDVPVVVKVRFHEAHNSRDVLDFLVLLSANDVFTGIVTEDSLGRAVFRSTDTPNLAGNRTCTIPTGINKLNTDGNLPNIPLSTAGFRKDNTDNDAGPVQTADRLKEGYIEFIVMGYAGSVDGTQSNTAVRQFNAADIGAVFADDNNATTPITTSLDAWDGDTTNGIQVLNVAKAIEDHVCDDRLDTAFSREPGQGGVREIVWTSRQLGEPITSLLFNFRLINVDRGVEAGNAATTWANFFNPGAGAADALIAPDDNRICTVYREIERHNADVSGQGAYRTMDWLPGAANLPANCQNLATEQQRQAFLEPTLNDAFPVVANFWSDTLNAAVSDTPVYRSMAGGAVNTGLLRGADAISATIQRRFVVNEWADNAAAGVSTDWIITQPTKQYYVDGVDLRGAATAADRLATNEQIQTALATERWEALVDWDGGVAGGAAAAAGGAAAWDPFADDYGTIMTPRLTTVSSGLPDAGFLASVELPLPPYENRWVGPNADACHTVSFRPFDRAEQSAGPSQSGVIVSPQLPETTEFDVLCHETTIVTFNGKSAFTDAGALAAVNRVNVDTTSVPGNPLNGWMIMDLADGNPQTNLGGAATATGLPVSRQLNGGAAADANVQGLPVIGFNLKVRSLGDASAASNYASTLDHGYVRD